VLGLFGSGQPERKREGEESWAVRAAWPRSQLGHQCRLDRAERERERVKEIFSFSIF
jgi:hypothetical protein